MYKHRCPLPFHHLAIRPDDQVFPCCQFSFSHTPDDMNMSYPDVFNHPFMEQLRESMVKDEYVPGCERCYKTESVTDGELSMRLSYIEKLGLEIPEKPVLSIIDLALSNVCNNKCRMCGPDLSTSWYSDAIKMMDDNFNVNMAKDFLRNSSGIKYSKELHEQCDLKQLRYIKLIGGEPLLEEEKFINILNKCDLDNLEIFLTTNSTIIPSKKMHDILKKCKAVTVNLSVDAYGELNNFLRKGSKWENVTNVIDWFAHNFPFSTTVFGVISIYNVNNFYELENFIKNKYSNSVRNQWITVQGVKWMQCCNLPEKVKDKILQDLKNKIDKNMYNLVKDEMLKPGNFKDFLKVDNKLNTIRNENWENANPQLYELVKYYIKAHSVK